MSKPSPVTVWETQRLVVTLPQYEDLASYQSLHADAAVTRYLGAHQPKNEVEIASLLAKYVVHGEKYGFSFGNIWRKSDGVLMGRSGMIYLDFDGASKRVEVGYILGQAYWGQGYATELVKTLVPWAFSHLAIEACYAVVHPDNQASQRVMEKNAFKKVGNYHQNGEVSWLYEKLMQDPKKI